MRAGQRTSGSQKAVLAIVGGGFRTRAFLRVTRELPSRFLVCGVVTRSADNGLSLEQEWGVPTYRTVNELLAKCSPDFVIVSVAPGVAPSVITEITRHGLPVLTETPPSLDVEGLLSLDKLVRSGARIQVAEQYHLEPLLRSQISIARSGRLGKVSEAFVSVCHDYHGVSLIRQFLGIGFEDATITAHEFLTTVKAGPDRAGDPREDRMIDEVHTTARLDFGDSIGTYDFSTDQYRSWIRSHHILVRGDLGELRDDELRYLQDFRTPMRLSISRVNTGGPGNHEGFYLRGLTLGDEWVYVNGFSPARLADDELSIATLLTRMIDYTQGGPDVYSLADASQDQYLQLVVRRAVQSGESIRTQPQRWARSIAR
jgi:predicted dehydrogenase